MEGARDFWAQECHYLVDPPSNPGPHHDSRGVSVLYDTTFNTNRGGLKLGLITGVDQEGFTRILMVSMVMYQGAADFEWVFKHLIQCFHIAPKIIFTDSDNAMATAIKTALPDTKHLFCTWHLSNNMNINCAPAMTKVQYKKFSTEWWRVCKNSDQLSINTFDQDWQNLVTMVPIHEFNDNYITAMKWLKKIYERRHQWAARWTWGYMTVGRYKTIVG